MPANAKRKLLFFPQRRFPSNSGAGIPVLVNTVHKNIYQHRWSEGRDGMNPIQLPRKGAANLPPLDETARERAESHLRMARRLAWKQFLSCAKSVPLDELQGEALHALCYAAGMFDDSRGVPFGAYATMAIRHRLIQAVRVWLRGGRLAHVRFTDLTANTKSMVDVSCPRTRESSDDVALRDLLDRVRRVLPPRWFQALQLYYAHGYTLEEVGNRLGVTRERIRQMLSKAVGRARQNVAAISI
jgi:RNA polymerase sigma factor (sigma-70 family)